MKRALATIGVVLLLLALLAGAASRVGSLGKAGPYLVPTPIDAAQLSRVVAERELGEGGGDRQHIVFGRRYNGRNGFDFRAAIVVVKENVAMEVPLDPTDFGGLLWVHVARSGDGKTIWALADNGVESPGWMLELVVSNDAGATWRHFSTVPKPYYWGTFESFRMSKSGRGAVGIRLDTPAPANGGGGPVMSWLRGLVAQEEGTPGEEQPAGLYVYRTKNGGLTWSGPEYFEDDTEDAWESDDVGPPGFGMPPEDWAASGGSSGSISTLSQTTSGNWVDEWGSTPTPAARPATPDPGW